MNTSPNVNDGNTGSLTNRVNWHIQGSRPNRLGHRCLVFSKRAQLAVHLVIHGKTSSVVDNGKVAFYHFAVQIRIYPPVSGVAFPESARRSIANRGSMGGKVAWRCGVVIASGECAAPFLKFSQHSHQQQPTIALSEAHSCFPCL